MMTLRGLEGLTLLDEAVKSPSLSQRRSAALTVVEHTDTQEELLKILDMLDLGETATRTTPCGQ